MTESKQLNTMQDSASFMADYQGICRRHAAKYAELGFFPVPLFLGTKRPAVKSLLGLKSPPLHMWKRDVFGVGLLTGPRGGGLVVVDCDSMLVAECWNMAHGTHASVIVQSPNGMHFWYRTDQPLNARHRVQWDGETDAIDFRANGQLITAPPTICGGKQYRFRQQPKTLSEVEQWEPQLLPQDDSRNKKENLFDDGTWVDGAGGTISNGEAYISKIFAVQGERGDNATFRAVCKLRDSGMDTRSAYRAMVEWNKTNAKPPWTEKELEHKVRKAYQSG